MSYRLFLDDERFPPKDTIWEIARSFDEAVQIVRAKGIPSFISFDHDLGKDPTGYDFAKWLCDYAMDHDISLRGISFYVHSQNPVGRDNIIAYMNNFIKRCP